MLIDGGLAHAQPLGDFPERQSVAEVHLQNLAAHGWVEPFHALYQQSALRLQLFRGACFHLCLKQVQSLGAFLHPGTAGAIQAGVAHTGHQESPGAIFLQLGIISQQSAEDLVHYVLAFLFVVYQHHGHAQHVPMVLHEESLYLSFALRHIPYIHTNYDLLNPFWQQIYKKLISFSSYSFANWIIAIIFALEKIVKITSTTLDFTGKSQVLLWILRNSSHL